MTDIAKLRADLADLNLKCQEAGYNEVRYGLQRSRLEAERAQLLMQMVETVHQSTPATVPYRITMQSSPIAPNKPKPATAPRNNLKPDGLPSMSAMVMSVFDNAEVAGLRPKQIRERIRAKYWPEVPANHVTSVAWKLAKDGKLSHSGGRYRLNRYNGNNGSGH
jgi:hypothetical protein